MTAEHPINTKSVIEGLRGTIAGNVFLTMQFSPNFQISDADLNNLSSQVTEMIVHTTLEKMESELDQQTIEALEAEIKQDIKGTIAELATDLQASTSTIYEKHGVDATETSFDDALMNLNDIGVNLPAEIVQNSSFIKNKEATQPLERAANKVANTAIVMDKLQGSRKAKNTI